MKKRWLLSACLIVCFLPLSAQQRLAVFSAGNDSAGQLFSISIDFFRSVPAGQLYGPIGDHFAAKYVTFGHSRFDGKAKADLSRASRIGYFGVNNEQIPVYYSRFLEGIIAAYKAKRPGFDTLDALQDEVWTYNVMDELGFINRAVGNQLEEFKKAKKQYTFRYGLADANQETDSTAQAPQTMLSKASRVYFNRKYNIKGTEKPDSIQFNDTSIIYRQQGAMHTITPRYNDIPIPELENFSAVLKEAIYLYIQDYRIHPEHVNFSKSLADPAGFVLTFSALTGNPGYTMNFKMPTYQPGQ